MSTGSLQLSTLERSLISGTSISVDSLTARVRSCFLRRTLFRFVGAKSQDLTSRLRALDGRCGADAPEQFLELRLEHAALGFGIGGDLLETPPHLGLQLDDAAVERDHPFVALALERRCGLRESPLETPRACVPDVCEAFGEDDFGVACERLDRAVELACEPARGVLAAGLHERCELLRRLLRERRRRTLDHAGDLLDLPALYVLEAHADALRRLDLFALDSLHELLLASPHPLLQLMQGATAVERLGLDLAARCLEDLGECLFDLAAEAHDSLTLRLALGLEPLCVGLDAGSGVGEKLPLPPGELGEPLLHRVRAAVEVEPPLGESLRHLCLRLRERLDERRGELALAVDEGRSPALRNAALLLGEDGDRIGARAGERVLELCRALGRRRVEQLLKACLRCSDVRLGRGRTVERPLDDERGGGGEGACSDASCGDRELARSAVMDRVLDPGGYGAGDDAKRHADEDLPREPAQRGSHERQCAHDGGERESDLEAGRQRHCFHPSNATGQATRLPRGAASPLRAVAALSPGSWPARGRRPGGARIARRRTAAAGRGW